MNRLKQKIKYSRYTIKILNIQNKERIIKCTREKEKVIYKDRSIKITHYFSMVTLKANGSEQILHRLKKTTYVSLD